MLEAVQKHAARWILSKWNPNTFTWSKPTEACLQEFCWPSLARRRVYLCVAYLFDLLHQRYTLSLNSFCSFKPITYLRAHTLSLQTVGSTINAYRYSYFVNIPFYGTPYHLILCHCPLPANSAVPSGHIFFT